MPKVISTARGQRRLTEQHRMMTSTSSADEHMSGAATAASRTNGRKQKRNADKNMNVASIDGLVEIVRHELVQNSDRNYKEWITKYMKDAVPYIGCKVPVVERVVRNVVNERIPMQCSDRSGNKGGGDRKARNKYSKDNHNEQGESSINLIIDSAFALLQQPEGDVKISGMVLLSDYALPVSSPPRKRQILERLENEILIPAENGNSNTTISIDGKHVNDWATSDALSMRVLKKIALASGDSKLTLHVLDYATNGHTLWHRRCGLIPFLTYRNHLDTLPDDIGVRLVDATERCLQLSPTERFTQTGCAWLLRYILLENGHCEYALQMIVRNGPLWTKEALKSIVKRLNSNDPRRKQILDL